MKRSLRQRLLVILSVSVVSAWFATALFSYFDTRRLIDDMLDTRLVQSAEIVLTLFDQVPPDALSGEPLEHNADTMMAYRVWTAANDTVIGSPGMPTFAPASWQPGFSDKTANGVAWRVYGARSKTGLFIEVAQRDAFRATFAENVATHIMHPVWFAVPLLGLLIWLSVRWGLAPLQTIADNVERRSAGDLQPLETRQTPSEVRPLIAALNRLFARIGALLDKERQFTADAAHELRTPLAAIKTHAQVALQARGAGQSAQAITNVIAGTDRAIRLVEQLLILARLDHQSLSTEQRRIDLAEIAVRGVRDAAPNAGAKHIDLGMSESDQGRAIIFGNEDLVEILIRNLLDNAVRYTPEDGTVNVGVKVEGDNVILEVADTGPGIAPERRARAFDRFYRIEGTGEQGCGLGLSIVSRIAEILGASVDLNDGPDDIGLVVTVTFPATTP